jgi:hypothetical protein
VIFGIRKKDLISGRSLLLYQFTRRMIKLTVVIIVGYHCNITQNLIQYSSLMVKSIYGWKLLGIVSVGSDVTDQQLIRSDAGSRHGL